MLWPKEVNLEKYVSIEATIEQAQREWLTASNQVFELQYRKSDATKFMFTAVHIDTGTKLKLGTVEATPDANEFRAKLKELLTSKSVKLMLTNFVVEPYY